MTGPLTFPVGRYGGALDDGRHRVRRRTAVETLTDAELRLWRAADPSAAALHHRGLLVTVAAGVTATTRRFLLTHRVAPLLRLKHNTLDGALLGLPGDTDPVRLGRGAFRQWRRAAVMPSAWHLCESALTDVHDPGSGVALQSSAVIAEALADLHTLLTAGAAHLDAVIPGPDPYADLREHEDEHRELRLELDDDMIAQLREEGLDLDPIPPTRPWWSGQPRPDDRDAPWSSAVALPALPALARTLLDLDIRFWSDSELREVAARRGWSWRPGWRWQGSCGPVALGLAETGPEARLYPLGDGLASLGGLVMYDGLAVLVRGPDDATPAAAADTFHAAAAVLDAALGPPTSLGAHGETAPHTATPPWGSPYCRWREHHNTLELRAGTLGPELLLVHNDRLDGSPLKMAPERRGFLGLADGDLDHAGGRRPDIEPAEDWLELGSALHLFFLDLPATARALGLQLQIELSARTEHGTRSTLLILAGSGLELGINDTAGLPEAQMIALGWSRATASSPGPPADPAPVAFRSSRYRCGEVDPHALAELAISTLRRLGVPGPHALRREACRYTRTVDGRRSAHRYDFTFYGLPAR